MMKHITRRNFIGTAARGAALITAAGFAASCSDALSGVAMPTRKLGKTGLDVSILSFGGGSNFMKCGEGDWQKLMEKAIKAGVNMFDTAPSYSIYKAEGQSLGSDERFGEILPAYRKDVVIVTKLETRNPEEVKKEVEESLARMKTDYIDILMIHAVKDSDDVAVVEKGIYKEMQDLKRQGVVRFIGFSSMDSAQRSKDMLDNLDIDAVMLAMNATRYGDFAKLALPSAIRQNTGVIAMKVMRNIVGKDATPRELLEYAWGTEGVASAVIAHDGFSNLAENLQLSENYHGKLMAVSDRLDLERRMQQYAGPHALVWARPGYTDGMHIA